MEHIRACKAFVFYVFGDRAQVAAAVAKESVGTAARHGTTLFVREEHGVAEYDISSVKASTLISSVHMADAMVELADRIRKESQLREVHGYALEVSAPGSTVRVPHTRDRIAVFALTEKRGNMYFDLVSHGGEMTLAFNCNRFDGMGLHSGDKGTPPTLLHHLRFPGVSQKPFGLAVVGYNRNSLSSFVEQMPVVVLVDHTSEILHIVPCPLDTATIGQATMSVLATAQREGAEMVYHVLNMPALVNNVDTGDRSDLTCDLVNRALEHKDDLGHDTVTDESVGTMIEDDGDGTVMPSHIVQHGVVPHFDFDRESAGFSSTVTMSSRKEPGFTLPCLFAPLRGRAVVLMGKHMPVGSHAAVLEAFERRVGVVEVSEDMLEQVPMSPVRANGLYIVHSQQEDLAQVNVTAVSRLAGPSSIVLVCRAGKLLWFRGVRWPGLVDTLPDFGDDVTAWFPREVSDWVLPFPVVETEVLLQVPQTLSDVIASQDDLVDMLTRASVMMTATALKDMVSDVVKRLLTMLRQRPRHEGGDFTQIRVSGEARRNRRALRLLIQKLGSVTSVRSSTTRAHDLRMMARKDQIARNVDASQKMSLSDFGETMETTCQQHGAALFRLSSDEFEELMSMARSGDLMWSPEHFLMFTNDRAPVLDCVTMGAMLEAAESHRMHPMAAQGGLAMPVKPGSHESVLALPLFDRYVECKDPATVRWIDECNTADVSAFRIRLRGNLVSCSVGRGLSPASPAVGRMLVYMILSSLEAYTRDLSGPEHVSGTTLEVIRGLFGFLFTTMASGARPMCMAYQLGQANPRLTVPNDDDAWMYYRVIQLYPFTQWPAQAFHANVKRLLVRRVRRVTDAALEPMLKALHQVKADERTNHAETRNKELEWCAVAYRLVLERADGHARRRCLSKMPNLEEPRQSTAVLRRLLDTGAEMSEQERVTLSNMYCKRSAVFKRPKEKMQQKPKAGAKMLAEVVEKVEEQTGAKARVQNVWSIKLGCDLAGDAELKRVPWSIDQSTPNIKTLYEWCLDGGGVAVPDVPLQVAKKAKKEDLLSFPGSSKAVALQKNVPKPEDLGLLGSLMTSRVVKKCVKTFLQRWRESSVDVETDLVNKMDKRNN